MPRATETLADFDLDLNPSDDPDAGFVYIEPESPAHSELFTPSG